MVKEREKAERNKGGLGREKRGEESMQTKRKI